MRKSPLFRPMEHVVVPRNDKLPDAFIMIGRQRLLKHIEEGM